MTRKQEKPRKSDLGCTVGSRDGVCSSRIITLALMLVVIVMPNRRLMAGTPAQERVQTAAELQRTFDPELHGWGLRFVARGQECDVLHMEATEVNLYPEMMEAIAYGTVEYGKILPGGVNKLAFGRGFRTVVYTNAHNRRSVAFGEKKFDRRSVAALRVCTDVIAAKVRASQRSAVKVETPKLEALSWSNVTIGAKLYDGANKHEATVVDIDRASGVIRVRYVSSGAVEPKLLAYVARYWYVKPSQKKR